MMGLNGRKPGTLHANNKGAERASAPVQTDQCLCYLLFGE